MHLQTRKILELLSEETTDAVLAELRNGPRTEAELKELGAIDGRALGARLKELRELEVIDFERSPRSGKKGPRPRLFRVIDPELFYEFCDRADDFALALAEARVKSLKEHRERREAGA